MDNDLGYKQLATEMLHKRGDRLYCFMSYDDCEGIYHPLYYKYLTHEQLLELRNIVEKCEAENIGINLYFCDKDLPDYIVDEDTGQHDVVYTVDFDVAYYHTKVKLAIFRNGLDEVPEIVNTKVVLRESDYVALLVWQIKHRYAGYNDLYYYDSYRFSCIEEEVRNSFGYPGIEPRETPTFTVELTGVKEDAYNLCGEPDILCTIWNSVSTEDHLMEYSVVRMKDRLLLFSYEAVEFDVEGDRNLNLVELYNIDALAVEKALGVDSYKRVADVLKARFSERDGIDRFMSFLNDNNISYQKKESTNYEPIEET